MTDLKHSIDSKRQLLQNAVLNWATGQLREYPWRKGGRNPYEILVAELLLKRTTATAVARIYDDFLHRFPSLKAFNEVSEEELASALSRVGLHRQRAKSIKALAQYLTKAEKGNIPGDLHRLLAIPGIGEYSARAVLSFGFGFPVAVLDVNVERILARVFQNFLPPRAPQSLLQELADALIARGSHRDYNLAMLDLGALVCRYVDPRCKECPLGPICDYRNLTKDGLIKEKPGRYETSIGRTIRGLRQEKCISLAKLAHLSGVSKLTIIRIESGRSSPRPETLRKIANALNVESCQLR